MQKIDEEKEKLTGRDDPSVAEQKKKKKKKKHDHKGKHKDKKNKDGKDKSEIRCIYTNIKRRIGSCNGVHRANRTCICSCKSQRSVGVYSGQSRDRCKWKYH